MFMYDLPNKSSACVSHAEYAASIQVYVYGFQCAYLQFGGNSLTIKYTGHMENFEDLKTATPSVFI